MITCEHCGSPLPDGAIFCGECGRAVTGTAARRTSTPGRSAAPTPPPLRAPGPRGVHRDPASEAWLPESTLDPATRAWLTGDRADAGPASAPAEGQSADFRPRTAPTHVHGSGSGLGDWTGRVVEEPPLDPDAFPTSPPSGGSSMQPRRQPRLGPDVDPAAPVDRTGVGADTGARGSADAIARDGAGAAGVAPSAAEDTAPVWGSSARPTRAETNRAVPGRAAPDGTPSGSQLPSAAPAPSSAPTAPSWWIDRGPSASTEATAAGAVPDARARPDATAPATSDDEASVIPAGVAGGGARGADDGSRVSDPGSPDADAPRPGDTAIVPPLVTPNRAPRTASLVAPSAQGATCHVCGHLLEPDDIFCEECGAVVSAVTAAYTGPVVPLPLARPDWSVTDDDAALGGPAVEPADGTDTDREPDVEAHGASQADEPSVPPAPGGATPSARERLVAWAGRRASSGDPRAQSESGEPRTTPDGGAAPAAAAEDGAGAAPAVRPVTAPVPTSAEEPDDVPQERVPQDGVEADGAESDGEDVDATRIVARAPDRTPMVLHFSTGERVGVRGSALVGRLPRPTAEEHFDDLVTIVDTGKSVSKTHLELGRDGDDLWVSDRASGNGTVVRHVDGSIRRCEPGRRYRVERGARVDIGEQFFLVQ
ncbi:zinc-ribbon domain-containing protein [Curtobacterium sp. RRHDQ10]|uniref:zinc-ribbon domain-containing protein n=1 Tax=Curtobacterium phyllosphaerae TaxID=3413379 RepID=UPI003BF0D254